MAGQPGSSLGTGRLQQTINQGHSPCHSLLTPHLVAIKGSGVTIRQRITSKDSRATTAESSGFLGQHGGIHRDPWPPWGDLEPTEKSRTTVGKPRETKGHYGQIQGHHGGQRHPETPRRNKEPQRGHPEQPWGVFSGLQDHHKGILGPHGGILAQLLSSSTENSASTGRPCLLHPRSTQGRRHHRPRW